MLVIIMMMIMIIIIMMLSMMDTTLMIICFFKLTSHYNATMSNLMVSQKTVSVCSPGSLWHPERMRRIGRAIHARAVSLLKGIYLRSWRYFRNSQPSHHQYHQHHHHQDNYPLSQLNEIEIAHDSSHIYQKVNHHIHFQTVEMDASKNSGTPKSSIKKLGFHYQSSILGYPYFWKHPNFKKFVTPPEISKLPSFGHLPPT